MMILCIDTLNRISEKWIFWKNCKMRYRKLMIEYNKINENQRVLLVKNQI